MIGALFIFSGFLKLTSPYQNFWYVIQGYDILVRPLDEWTAIVFPWIEFFVGVFLFFGLWTELFAKAALFMFTGFIVILGQALIRQLPLEECGCFGERFSLSPRAMLILDSVCWLLMAVFVLNLPKANRWSLDHYFSRSS